METQYRDLPGNVSDQLRSLISVASEHCAPNLQSVILFGSAAEGRLRKTSDVNVILIMKSFEIEQVNSLREFLRISASAVRLNVMFLLESEINSAMDVFAVKFADILERHRVLWGRDPFAQLAVDRSAAIQRLHQVILNLVLRLRERYAFQSLREEQMAIVVAETAGPLRAAAKTLLTLQGSSSALPPKEALQKWSESNPGNWQELLQTISMARETRSLPPGQGSIAVRQMLEMLDLMYKQVRELSAEVRHAKSP